MAAQASIRFGNEDSLTDNKTKDLPTGAQKRS